MTQHHAMRRGVTPRPSTKDLQRWERLLKRAAPLARDPMLGAGAFAGAADKAAKAIMPVGHQSKDSAFCRLVRLGQGFLKLGPVERMAAGPEIARLIEACRAVLDAPAPERRQRKDIDE